MRKHNLVILSLIMLGTFFGLVLLQYHYFNTLVQMRTEYFDQGVKQSLYQVCCTLEDEETLSYINQALQSGEEEDYGKMSIKNDPITVDLKSPTIKPVVTNLVKDISKHMQDQLKQKYARKKVAVNDVAMRWLQEAPSKPIQRRIDMEHTEQLLRNELYNMGIETPFYMCLINYKGERVYLEEGYDSTAVLKNFYSQVLFPNDYNPKINILRVYFPERQHYILQSVLKLAVTSMVMSIILFITFVSTIILLIRQHKTAKVKTDFMNNMTHEFKTPISSISLASQMLNDESVMKMPGVYKRIAKTISDETRRLSFLVEKVLQISLLENEKAIMRFKEVDVNALVLSVVDNFKIKVKSKGGTIRADLKATNAMIMADELHFTNVIFNLLDNAVKYAKPDEELCLVVKTANDEEGNHLIIKVEDNGIGIAKDHVKKIFDKFHRVPTGNVHNVKGFGLGLAYVKKMVQKHNGTIKAESELGVGTIFTINIPTLKK